MLLPDPNETEILSPPSQVSQRASQLPPMRSLYSAFIEFEFLYITY